MSLRAPGQIHVIWCFPGVYKSAEAAAPGQGPGICVLTSAQGAPLGLASLENTGSSILDFCLLMCARFQGCLRAVELFVWPFSPARSDCFLLT